MRLPKQSNPETDKLLQNMYGNKLDAFRTYSYFHVLGVCTAQNARNISPIFEDPVKFKALLNKPTPKDEYGFREPLYVDDVHTDQNMYYILLNGLQDVDIAIESMTAETIVAVPQIGTGTASLQAMSGQLVVQEPQGIKLMNIFRNMCTVMNTNAQDMRIILKTIFVGQTDDTALGFTKNTGEGATIGYVLDIPAIYGAITTFQVAVTEKGSVYTVGFLNQVGGIALDPNLTSSSSGQMIRGSGSVGDMLDHLAQQYTDDAQKNLLQLAPEVAKNKRPVKYSIEIHPKISFIRSWTTNTSRNTRTAGANGSQPNTVPANVSLEGAISYIFENCEQYIKQGSANPLGDEAFHYRVLAVFEADEHESRAIYKIMPSYFNRQDSIIKKMKAAADPELGLVGVQNVVIYDYIFTGHNTDIESFDMQIEEGSGFFNTIVNVQTFGDSTSGTSTTAGTTAGSNVGAVDGATAAGRVGSVGTRRNSAQTKSGNQGLSAQKEAFDVIYDKTWQVGAAKQAAVLRTRGHTGWFKLFAINPFTRYDSNNLDASVGSAEQVLTSIPDVYLNIMMPSTASGNTTADTRAPTYEKFWFKGLWKVMQVTNIFNDGVFTTELALLAINLDPIVTHPTETATAGNQEVESKKDPATQPLKIPGTTFVNGSTNGRVVLGNASSSTQLTKSFTLGNFTATSKVASGKNNPDSQAILDNLVNLASVLQGIKDALGIPIVISSGYRNDTVNRAVGGAANSDHKLGEAVDFTSPNARPNEIVDAIIAMKVPFKQLILETPPGRNPWVHLSVSRSTTSNKNTALAYSGGAYMPYKGVA